MCDKINEYANKILCEYQLCDACFGRIFRDVKKGLSNKEKGQYLREKLKIKNSVDSKNCWLCEGLTDEIEYFIDLISNELKEYEFDTFLIGSKVDSDIIEKEKIIWNQLPFEDFEPIKMEVNREIGKILEEKLNKNVEFEKPDITAVIDTSFNVVNLQIKSLFLYGRYKKYKRGIPQTRWPCNICRGKGCKSCNYSGKMYINSVEELISKRILEFTEGIDESFHGCGREDIDVLMLGNGRPFVIEVKNPKKRNIDINLLLSEINLFSKDKVEVINLRFSDKKEIERLKSAVFNKTYSIIIEGEKALNKEKLKEAAQLLQGNTIEQLTPTRVAHRRADKVRVRKIYNCKIESVEGTIANIKIETESGTYVKELISGDSGRTKPNISDMVGIPCKVKELDVLEIKGE